MAAGHIVIQFFTRSLEVLPVGELLGGVLAPVRPLTYLFEVCLMVFRGS